MNNGKRHFYSLVAEKFMAKTLNKVGLALVIIMIAVALLAPLLANNKPYYYVDHGHITMPILADVVMLRRFFSYPEYRDTDFRKLKAAGAALLLPPIPYSATESDLAHALVAPQPLHWMGTDDQGRDIAARMIYGAQISLSVGFVAVSIYVVLGILIGALAGFYGGWVDIFISRIIEIVMCFPTFFLILAVQD